jgi:plasmid maintenance system antidote protein VapI
MLTKALRRWAEEGNISPTDFAQVTGYTYQHAYNLLRGNGQVTDDTLGRILRTYGSEVAAEIVKLSQAESSTVNPC